MDLHSTGNQIIHIGYPKTATTWFQQEFFPGVTNFTLVPRKVIKKYIIQPTPVEFSAQSVKRLIEKEFGKQVILSEELIVGSIRSGGFNFIHTINMANRLKYIFPKAFIIVFIRSQPEIIASAYGQYIKDGGKNKIGEYLEPKNATQMVKLRSFNWKFLDYNHVITLYKELFPEKTRIYLYEDFASDTYNFIKEFSEENGFIRDLDQLSFNDKNKRPNNLSVKRLANRLRFLRLFFPAKWAYGLLHHQKIFTHRQSSKEILGEFYEQIIDYYSVLNRLLIDKHNLTKISKFNYPL